MKPSMKVWRTSDEKSPYINRSREYDGYIDKAYRERDTWRLVAVICLCFVGVAILGLIYVGSLPSVIPHVIEIAPWGEAKYTGPIGKNTYDIVRSEISIQYYLRQFLRNTRTISTDIEVVRSQISLAFKYVTNSAYNRLRNDIATTSFFTRSQRERVDISIQSLLKITSTSYQIDWLEVVYSLNGKEMNRRLYRGIYNVIFAEPAKEQRIYNPLGIFIDGYDIQEIRTSEE